MQKVTKLTDRQKVVLDYIRHCVTDRGYPPTIREIGSHLGIRSTNGVNDHLKALEKKGYLRRTELKSRALQLTSAVPAMIPRNGDIVEVPVIGRVAAGEPILAHENIEDTVKVDRFFIGRGKEVFALKVVGESMIEDGIHDGDYIFVRQQLEAEPGGIVVAMIEGEATVKRYFPEGDLIRFQPANSEMDPILVRREDFRRTDLIGVVVGVYRKYS